MNLIQDLCEQTGNAVVIRTAVPLAPYSTFGIGGPADFLIEPITQSALIQTITYLNRHTIRYAVFGNASNVVFSDRGFRGAVILTRKINRVILRDNGILEAETGASLIGLSALALQNSLSGLEFACGIPASLGGAILMNAGAHGGEMKDIVQTSEYLAPDGCLGTCLEHDFSYRHSIYQNEKRIILSARLQLMPGNRAEIEKTMSENRKKREATQPIREKSAGSVFRRMDGVIPAKLIDEAGLKGLAVNDAAVSEKHAGFIVNRGHATATDVKLLIEKIREIIFQTYHILLKTEIEFVEER